MDTENRDELEWAKRELAALRESVRSCVLATASSSGQPLSSYAPVFIDEAGDFFVYVSAMAKHYAHLKKTGKASLSLIEDESVALELFARKRVTVDCEAELMKRDSAPWIAAMAGLEARHGATVGYLKGLLDFDLFRLRPSEGRLVLGFGKAYRVSGPGLAEVAFLGAGGHRSAK
ncbi:pyridoxamine 5'-phosphate oxidase family protein [Pelagicoccus sp. SDUM812005]|uniref:HugZ family pyridoxamine 5'-phosphate oxidase n=1 Tax=Pelagicoccus sp. SDUM812005 TaxID=3041257 RepID=UPI00280FB0D6|nr:pyridoxamine 5'-phosphate oxidase family protein [Pelagicoccus sp. SDUM812005]MDQ8180230.1 pyridoxamine 5'-phosphate oxidase family protein [Pelagicoccus sp. SDUM812005]